MAGIAKMIELTTTSKVLVSGMDCPDCAAKVEKAVKRMPGVVNAAITFPAGRLTVEYEALRTGIPQVVAKIKKLGYEAHEDLKGRPNDPRITELGIMGMDYAGCADFADSAAKAEPRISEIPGEKTEPVSFWAANMYVKPTIASLIMLILGLVSGRLLGAPDMLVSGLFLTGIILGAFWPAQNGISVLINAREFDMNLLMTIAIIGASALGEFEEAAMVVFLFSGGNALQGYTLDKTRNSIRALMKLTPGEALVRRESGEIVLFVEQIIIGDIMIIRPGERIAMDGRVCSGYSTVNQAPITGESMPVEKQAGDEIYAGSINERGSLEVEVTKLARDNTMARIIHMVEEAQGQRAPSQQFVDRFARYYTPAVMAVAILVAVVPMLVFGQPFQKWFYEAMAMLLVACPCALIISTPVAIVSAIGNAARNGVLVKGGMYLEEAGALSVVAFDKTGTLTEGQPRVTDVIPVDNYSPQEVLAIAATIETRSEHPLGDAIINCAREQGLDFPPVSGFEAVIGQGARAIVAGKSYQIGNARFFTEQGLNLEPVEKEIVRLQNEGKTVMILGNDHILGLIAVADALRENSRPALQNLKRAGIKKVIMLTGDNEGTARAVAAQAGIDEFRADLLPEDKVDAIKRLLTEHGKVAMIGDGVNDAPAMAISTVGIAMGAAGTDAALETADIALMADDLSKLAYTIRLSHKTLGIIKQNIGFALIVKTLILLLVIPGWLTLWLAVAGDMGTTLLVTLNGMRLIGLKHRD